MMNSSRSPADVHDLVYQQRVLQEQDRNRLAIMHTAVNTMGLRDVRPTQDEDAMFPTPGNSPPYTANDGGACYQVPAEIGCQYTNTLTQPSINAIEMPTVPTSSATPYINAPSSPVEDTYYHGHSPYSSPYEDSSSPQSIACSPHSTVSCNSITGANYEQFIPPQPAADPLTTMATTGVSLPPITSIPLTTASCTSLEYQPEMENHQKCIYTTAPPLHIAQHVFFPPVSQTGEWTTSHQAPPPNISRFTEPNFVPPHSAAMIGTSVAEGELPINVIINEQQFPDTDSISYYPLTPESPEDRQTAYICQDFAAMPKEAIFLPPGTSPMTICPPFSGPVKPNRAPKRKRPEKPAVQVDDSEIKDIPTSAQLWEFTLRVLKKPKYHYMVNWENKKEGLFRFHDAQAFAALWGKHRNRPNMTYDKVARALRYYYKRDILNQVGGRLTYRFSKRLSKLYMTDE